MSQIILYFLTVWLVFCSTSFADTQKKFTSEELDAYLTAMLLARDQMFFCVSAGAMHYEEYDEKFSPAEQKIRDQVFLRHLKGDGTGFILTLDNKQNIANIVLPVQSEDKVLKGTITFQNAYVVNAAFDWVASGTLGFSGERYSQTTSLQLLRDSNEFFQSILTVDVHGESAKSFMISGGNCEVL